MANEEIARLAREHGLERLADVIARAALPAIHLAKAGADAVGSSRLGGLPGVAASFAWPRWKGRPLGFLGQIRCEEMADADAAGLLPRRGLLDFFYDLVDQPWGFDPKDRGGAVVLHAESATALSRAAAPEGHTLEIFTPVAVRPRPVPSVPAARSTAFDSLGLTEDEWDQYQNFYEAVHERFVGDAPKHQLLGHSNNVQDDMQLECQLVTHGLYCGDDRAWKSPRGAELEPGAAEWRLLCQLDSDDDLDVMGGDCGMVYYWLREADLRARRFGESWTVLQCS